MYIYRVVLIGDFNVPGFDWEYLVRLASCHFYSKIKREAIYASMCFLGLSQLNALVINLT
jgi:hypothetical protein